VRRGIAVAICALAANGPAFAATPIVPQSQLVQLRSLLASVGAADLVVLPTRAPAHYKFESYSVTGSPAGLDLSLADQRHVATPTQTMRYEISYDTAYVAGRCSARSKNTVRVGGTPVYSDGRTVWRCVRGSRGRLVKASAHGPARQQALATLVASARPVR
jgi:hypothetical protein